MIPSTRRIKKIGWLKIKMNERTFANDRVLIVGETGNTGFLIPGKIDQIEIGMDKIVSVRTNSTIIFPKGYSGKTWKVTGISATIVFDDGTVRNWELRNEETIPLPSGARMLILLHIESGETNIINTHTNGLKNDKPLVVFKQEEANAQAA